MLETPPCSVPVDPKEQPVLDKFLALRNELVLLKRDRTAYVRASDIKPLFEKLVANIRELRELRGLGDQPAEPEKGNRVSRVVDDCAQLISLFFLTVGWNHEAPALYAPTLTARRLLDHLVEVNLYSGRDLERIDSHLQEMRQIIKDGEGTYAVPLLELLTRRVDGCQEQLKKLQEGMWTVSPELVPVHEKLISILRSTSAAATRHKFPTQEVENFRDELNRIDATRKDGHFLNADGKPAQGDALVSELLERLKTIAANLLENGIKVSDNLKPTYDKLYDIRNKLEKITLTQAWSLRETDLFVFQRELDQIDDARVDKMFVDATGQGGDGQHVLRYLLRRSYAYIYQLLLSSEPVSEALLPVYNQLQTLRKCLVEVKQSGGVASVRELYPYSMKLNSIRSMQVDGQFKVGNEVPDGQENVNTLLDECVTLCTGLKDDAVTEAK